VLVGIGKSGTCWLFAHTQFAEHVLHASNPTANIAQTVCPAQLAEEHGHKLRLAVEAVGSAFGLVLNDQTLEVGARK
jgi:hypothetical protein